MEAFVKACDWGDESFIGEMDPGIHNKQDDDYGDIGLIWALYYGRHSLSTSLQNEDVMTDLHYEVPLDIAS